AHSAIYLDPVREAPAFTLGLFEKMPELAAAELGAPGPDALAFGPPGSRLLLIVVGVSLSALGVAAFAPLVRRDRAARFFALGALLSLVPACATFASARQLLVPSIGFVGLVAQLVAAVVDRDPLIPLQGRRRRFLVGMAAFLGLSHAVGGPLLAQ